jgi:uncharacterized protein (TIGR02246 family)
MPERFAVGHSSHRKQLRQFGPLVLKFQPRRENMRKLLLMGGSILLLASLAMAAKGMTDEAAIRKLDADWSAAAQSKDVEKTISFYAADGSILPANAPKATGKEQIRAVWSHLLVDLKADVSFGPAKIEVAKSGDIAYDIGTYELKVKDAQGNAVTEIGKFVVVWKKQPDKQWKVAADIFNADK